MPRITISEPGKTPQPYRLKTDRESTKIGRGSDNDIILESGSASTYHCEMIRVDGGFILKDNDSTNGILLDDTQFEIIDLVDGMTVSIGEDIEYNFELSDEELTILEEENFEPKQRVAFPKSSNKPETRQKKKAVSLNEDEDEDEYEEVVVRRKVKKKAVSLDEDEDVYAKPKPRQHSRPASVAVAPAKAGGGFFTTLIFAILAVLFLAGGMTFRHYQDHKTFLFEKLLKK